MKQQNNTFQMKEQDKTPQKELSEVEISNLSDNEFKIMIIRLLNDLRRRINVPSEKFNSELENIFLKKKSWGIQ